MLSRADCAADTAALLTTGENWQIVGSGLPAQILWQTSEPRPLRTGFSGLPQSDLATYGDQLLYRWDYAENATSQTCENDYLISYDLKSGVENWRFPYSLNEGFKNIQPVNDGITLVYDQALVKLDAQGNEVWRNESFPSRSIGNVYENNNLYLPSYRKVFEVSNQSGEIVREIAADGVIAYFGNYVFSSNAPHMLEVYDAIDQSTFMVPIGDQTSIDMSTGFFYPFVAVRGDTLFVIDQYGDTRGVEGYSISTGQPLWNINQVVDTSPVITDDYLYIYAQQSLLVFDIDTGEQIGVVELERSSSSEGASLTNYHVWLAAHDNFVAVKFLDTWELVVIELQSS